VVPGGVAGLLPRRASTGTRALTGGLSWTSRPQASTSPRHRLFFIVPVTISNQVLDFVTRYWPNAPPPPVLAFRGLQHRSERYTPPGTPASRLIPLQVGILILDEDAQSQGALNRSSIPMALLVRMVPDTKAFLLADCAPGTVPVYVPCDASHAQRAHWFVTLRSLLTIPCRRRRQAPRPVHGSRRRREQYVEPLERRKLPEVLRPFHLHDFLEKVSDRCRKSVPRSSSAPGTLRNWRACARRRKKPLIPPPVRLPRLLPYTAEESADYEREEGKRLKKRPRGPLSFG